MRALLIALLLVQSSQVIQNKNKQPAPTIPANTESKADNQVSPSTPVVSHVVINENERENDKKKEKDGGHIDSYLTAVIALFTGLTFLIYRGQLSALKTSERAWMVSNSISEFPVYSSLGKQPTGQTFPARFEQTNRGRTPAWITAMGSRINLLPKGKTLPPEPTYDWATPFPPEGTVLPPNANIPQGVDITLADLSNVDNGAVTFYFYGVVQYRDVFRKKHETKYCYVFKPQSSATDPSPRDFYIGGPANYNKAT
jgi:hypothetical protein